MSSPNVLFLRRKAVRESLRDGTECVHLASLEMPIPSKQDRHREHTAQFRQTGEMH